MNYRFNRLVSFGPVIVDLINHVDRIPPSGGDAYISESITMVGGSFNTESAASRLGLKTVFAGTVGTGPYADLVLEALRTEKIEFAGRTVEESDTGFCFTMVEPDAERAFVTRAGAENNLTAEQFRSADSQPTDFIYISGYHLIFDQPAGVIESWITSKEANGASIVFDPASVIDQIDQDLLELMRQNSFIITCNAREFEFMKPRSGDPGFYVKRDGANPVLLYRDGRVEAKVAAHKVDKVKDTTGAGDVHTGALLAGLAEGLNWIDSLELANRAAALSTLNTGGSRGPTWDRLTIL